MAGGYKMMVVMSRGRLASALPRGGGGGEWGGQLSPAKLCKLAPPCLSSLVPSAPLFREKEGW